MTPVTKRTSCHFVRDYFNEFIFGYHMWTGLADRTLFFSVAIALSGGNNWLMSGHDGRIPGKGKFAFVVNKTTSRRKHSSVRWKDVSLIECS